MDTAAHELVANARRVIGLQIVIGLLAAAGFFMAAGRWESLSAGYGALISVVLAVLLGRGVIRAGEAARAGSRRGQWILYAGAAVRFVLVLVLFGAGLAGLGLDPLATVTGFITVQMAFLIVARRTGRGATRHE